MSQKLEYPLYGWLILAISWVCMFILTFGWYCMIPLAAKPLAGIYGTNYTTFLPVITFPYLIAAILCVLGGMLADTWGIRKTVTAGIIVGALGLFGRAIIPGGLALLYISMSGVGAATGIMTSNVPKMVSSWFSPERAGFANGIFVTGMFVGTGTGMAAAGYFPTPWWLTTILFGVGLSIAAVLYYVITRDSPPGKEMPPPNLLDGIKVAVRSRTTWAVAIGIFLSFGGMVSFQTTLPQAVALYGLNPQTIGGLLSSMITYLGVIGSLGLPLLTVKIKRKILIVFVGIITGLGIIFTFLLGAISIVLLWIGVIVVGVGGGGEPAFVLEVPILIGQVPEDPVHMEHVGGSSAIVTSAMLFGGFICPPYIIGSIINAVGFNIGYLIAGLFFGSIAAFALIFKYPKGM